MALALGRGMRLGSDRPPFGSRFGLGIASGSGGTPPVQDLVGGLAIGSIGTGQFAGLRLADGDDFDAVPSRWGGRNPLGRYAHSALSYAFRGTSPTVDVNMFVDPMWRGARNQARADLGIDRVQVAGSVATFTASAPEAAILDVLPTTYGARGDAQGRPKLLSGSLKTAPSFMLSAQADFAIDCFVKVEGGLAGGYWPSFWTTSFFWPDFGEVDLLEGRKNTATGITGAIGNLIVSSFDGGGAVTDGVSFGAMPEDRFVRMACIKRGGELIFLDDFAQAGMLAVRARITDAARVGRLRGAHDIRLDLAIANSWDGSTFDPAHWPKSVKFDWWRAWVPEAAPTGRTPMVVLPAVKTTAGGSWGATLPSTASLFGARPGLEQVSGGFDNTDNPGHAARNNATKLPGGMIVDLATRQISGTVPQGDGGRTFAILTYAYDDGSPAARVALPFDVAPVAQGTIFPNQTLQPGAAVDLTLAYTDFHSGNLGPHTYAVSKTGADYLTIADDGKGGVRITGTAPASAAPATLEIACTNVAGQTTTISRAVTVAGGAFTPQGWASAIEWWDANDPSKVFADAARTQAAAADASDVGALVGLKSGFVFAATDAGTAPAYVTDANGRRAVKFTRASVDRLVCDAAAIVANATGDDNAYAVIMAVKRGPAGVSVTPFSFSRDDTGTQNHFCRHFFGGTNAAGIQRTIQAQSLTAGSAAGAVPANAWYVVSWIFTGTTLTVRVNGAVVANAVALDTNAAIFHKAVLGSIYLNNTKVFDASTAFDGAIGEIGIIDAVPANDETLAKAETYLMTRWGVTPA